MAAGDTWTINVPDNFPGGHIGVLFESIDTTVAGTVSWTVDGVAQTTATLFGCPKSGRISPFFFRVALTAGRHKLVFTRVSGGAAGTFTADCWWVESRLKPAILVPLMSRPWKYNNTDTTTGDNGGPTLNGHMRTTLASGTTGGSSTTLSVNQATRADGTTQLRLFTTYPPSGTDVVIAPGTANEERFLTSGAVTGSGPYTITLNGTVVNTHATSTEVQLGISDAIVLHTINPAMRTVINEFDNSVIPVDVDEVFHGPSGPGNVMSTKVESTLSYDYTHPSDRGHQLLAKALWEGLERSPALTTEMISSTSAPTAPVLCDLNLISWGSAVTAVYMGSTNQSLALTSGGVHFRVRGDIRRCVEWRAVAYVTTSTSLAVDARIRPEYSIDNEVTWTTLGRLQFTANPPTDTDDLASDLILGTNGGAIPGWRVNNPPYPGTSAWHRIPQEAINEDTVFRFRNVQGTTTGTASLGTLSLQFR
jgi:hypothetical protein